MCICHVIKSTRKALFTIIISQDLCMRFMVNIDFVVIIELVDQKLQVLQTLVSLCLHAGHEARTYITTR